MKHRNGWLVAALGIVLAGCSGGDDDQGNINDGNNNNPRPICGNGAVEHEYSDSNEDCDGTDFEGNTCTILGWEGGELGCTPAQGLGSSCKFDTSLCTGSSPCGNGVVEPGENCDGDNVGEATCSSLTDGNFAGTLVCMPNCKGYNHLQCYPVHGNCGNGIYENWESCDDGVNNSDTLPDACRTNCSHPFCGDGVVDTGEECDDGYDNSNSIPDACRFYCEGLDCACRRAFCGDDVMDTGEECDGRDLGGLGCTDHGFAGGALACSADCTVDTSGCTP